MRVAVPSYVGRSFGTAPPGHRFRMYLEYWEPNWGKGKDTREYSAKKWALEGAVNCSAFMTDIEALRSRQTAVAPKSALTLHARSTAPFVTGMGLEHPLENGFAFLDPYGLPYLPGSSVKGVVRRAAEELALFEADSRGWTLAAVWWLFGFDASSGFFGKGKNDEPDPVKEERERWKDAYREWSAGFSPHQDPDAIFESFRKLVDPKGDLGATEADFLKTLIKEKSARQSIHTRGSIAFWDVIPKPKNNRLRVDIMNPHYGHYYQGNEPPHDAGSPNPIFYLTVPEGSEFSFIAILDRVGALPGWFTEDVDGGPRWRSLLEAAFEFAFDWLGFGAKTSLGYGGMELNDSYRPTNFVEATLEDPPKPGRQDRPQRRIDSRTADRSPTAHQRQPGPPGSLDSKISSVDPRDLSTIEQLANEIATLQNENERKLKTMALRERVRSNARARVFLNNHPVLKKYS